MDGSSSVAGTLKTSNSVSYRSNVTAHFSPEVGILKSVKWKESPDRNGNPSEKAPKRHNDYLLPRICREDARESSLRRSSSLVLNNFFVLNKSSATQTRVFQTPPVFNELSGNMDVLHLGMNNSCWMDLQPQWVLAAGGAFLSGSIPTGSYVHGSMADGGSTCDSGWRLTEELSGTSSSASHGQVHLMSEDNAQPDGKSWPQFLSASTTAAASNLGKSDDESDRGGMEMPRFGIGGLAGDTGSFNDLTDSNGEYSVLNDEDGANNFNSSSQCSSNLSYVLESVVKQTLNLDTNVNTVPNQQPFETAESGGMTLPQCMSLSANNSSHSLLNSKTLHIPPPPPRWNFRTADKNAPGNLLQPSGLVSHPSPVYSSVCLSHHHYHRMNLPQNTLSVNNSTQQLALSSSSGSFLQSLEHSPKAVWGFGGDPAVHNQSCRLSVLDRDWQGRDSVPELGGENGLHCKNDTGDDSVADRDGESPRQPGMTLLRSSSCPIEQREKMFTSKMRNFLSNVLQSIQRACFESIGTGTKVAHDASNWLHMMNRWQNLDVVLPVWIPHGSLSVGGKGLSYSFSDKLIRQMDNISETERENLLCQVSEANLTFRGVMDANSSQCMYGSTLRLRVAVIHKCPDLVVDDIAQAFLDFCAECCPIVQTPIQFACSAVTVTPVPHRSVFTGSYHCRSTGKNVIGLSSTDIDPGKYDNRVQAVVVPRTEEDQESFLKLMRCLDRFSNWVNTTMKDLLTSFASTLNRLEDQQQALLKQYFGTSGNSNHLHINHNVVSAVEFRFSPSKEMKLTLGYKSGNVEVNHMNKYMTSRSKTAKQARHRYVKLEGLEVSEIRLERDRDAEDEIDPTAKLLAGVKVKTKYICRSTNGKNASIFICPPDKIRLPKITVHNNNCHKMSTSGSVLSMSDSSHTTNQSDRGDSACCLEDNACCLGGNQANQNGNGDPSTKQLNSISRYSDGNINFLPRDDSIPNFPELRTSTTSSQNDKSSSHLEAKKKAR